MSNSEFNQKFALFSQREGGQSSLLSQASFKSLEHIVTESYTEKSNETSTEKLEDKFTEKLHSVPYIAQPQDFYAAQISCANTILLESAEMLNKRGTQSLIGVSCAVKVICHAQEVQLFALNANGQAFIEKLPLNSLASSVKIKRFADQAACCKDKSYKTIIEEDDNQIKNVSVSLMDSALEHVTNSALVRLTDSTSDCLTDKEIQEFCNKEQAHFLSNQGQLMALVEFQKDSSFCDELERLKRPNPLDVLRLMQCQISSLSQILFTGVIAFDFINTFEKVVDESVLSQGQNNVPDLCFYLYDLSILIDHVTHSTTICSYSFTKDANIQQQLYEQEQSLSAQIQKYVTKSSPSISASKVEEASKLDRQLQLDLLKQVQTDISDESFCRIVAQLKEHILQGDIFQAVPSRTFMLPCKDVDLSFALLKQHNPSPYMFCLKDPEFTLFGASPEFALRFDATSREVAISPIAGTRPRGRIRLPDGTLGEIDPSLDERMELELRLDHKEVAEHIMLLDLARNDLSRIAKTGTRHTENLLHVDRYQSVMHLVSDVKAVLRDDLDGLHAYLSAMNMGTLSGAPKIMAHQLIYKYEGKRRGAYGGVIARLSADGSFDSCIVIRSALVKQGMAYVQAGCGVVYDSQEQSECDETRNKAASVLSAIAKANRMTLQH